MSADLDLPALFDAGSIASWLEAWIEVEHSSALTVRVPAEAEVRPIGAALLAAAVAARGERGLSTRVFAEDPNGRAWAYLQRIAFFAELRAEIDGVSERPAEYGVHAPLLRLRDMAAARVQAEALAACIERDLPELAPSPARMARFVMEELGANIVQHSARASTGFGTAQAWKEPSGFELAFADAGVGFLASLQRHPDLLGRIANEAEALQLALAPGVTGGTDPRRNMGMGLKLLSSFADHLGGELWLGSGDAVLVRRSTASGQRVTTVRATPRWQGAWVCLAARY